MDLEDWEQLTSVESVIPCTTPTWCVYADDDGSPFLQRVIAWSVTRELYRDPSPKVVAGLSGLGAGRDGLVETADGASNFVGYLDERELDEAQDLVTDWLRQRQEAGRTAPTS